MDFEKHVHVRSTNSITAIVTEWIFYGLPFFTGFDFLDLTFTRLLDILLSTNQELLLRILFQVLSLKARWMESINGTKQDCAWELCVNTLKASCEEFVFVDQGLCKWILLASNSGTFAQSSLGNIREYFIGILLELYAIKGCSEGFFGFRDSQFFP